MCVSVLSKANTGDYALLILKHLKYVYWQNIKPWQGKFYISNNFYFAFGEKAEVSYSDEIPFSVPAFTQPLEVGF